MAVQRTSKHARPPSPPPPSLSQTPTPPLTPQFKTRSGKLEKALKAAKSDLTVSINPEKPRKGCFEVRVGDKAVLSLTDMARPFKALKALDIDEVAADVLKEL